MFRYLVTIFLMSASIQSYACSCPAFDLRQAVTDSDFVFFAQMTSAKVIPTTKDYWGHVEGTVKIEKILKGKFDTKTMHVATGLGGGDCGIPFSVPATYVIFLRKGSNFIGSCSGSKPLNQFSEFYYAEDLSREIETILGNKPKQSK